MAGVGSYFTAINLDLGSLISGHSLAVNKPQNQV